MRRASRDDVAVLVELMREFYAEAAFPLNEERATEAFRALLADDRNGEAWLAQSDGQDVAYMVLTFTFSMEYGGPAAFIDDLFVRPAFRNAGLGGALVSHARDRCVARGARAVHLEVGQENAVAQHLYRKAGFLGTDRRLLTLQLQVPTHHF